MNSIGILYTLRNSSEPSKNNVSAELHVNYWKVPIRNGAYKRFLDFGIFINDVARDVSANSTSKCKITKCFCKSTPLVLRNSISFLVSH